MRTRMLYLAALALGVLPGCPAGWTWPGQTQPNPRADFVMAADSLQVAAEAVTVLIQANKVKGVAADALLAALDVARTALKRWETAVLLNQPTGEAQAQAQAALLDLTIRRIQAEGGAP